MPSEIITAEGPSDDWMDHIDLSDIAEIGGELAKNIKYVKAVIGGYRWFKMRRAKRFIRALAAAENELDSAQKERLHKTLVSDEGAALLAEFTDTVLRTSSMTAIASLAILYADASCDSYSSDFKLASAIALEGISESHIDALLDLAQVEPNVPDSNQPNVPYPVAIANDVLIDGLPNCSDLLRPPEVRVAIIRNLIDRGLLLPDFASSRLSGGGVGMGYGISERSLQFRDLFIKARSLVPD